MKTPATAFLIAVLIFALLLAGNQKFGMVKASANVSGTITADTTWANANSPYSFSGNTLVSNGAKLTIEPGVTVNLNSYYLGVNGTLVARGTSNNKIHFNDGQIGFTKYSSSWNEKTGSGSIVQNSNLTLTGAYDELYINDASPKLDNNYIHATISITDGSPIISHNTIIGVANGGANH